jgi:glycosyltransferase involved in cell wall biosynthesis
MSQPKTRVAFFISHMKGAGAQGVFLALARGFAERDYAVDLVLAQAEGDFLDRVHPAVRIVDLKSSRVLTSLPALIGYLKRERPQALVSAMNYINLTALWARFLARVPVRLVITEHSTLSQDMQHTPDLKLRLALFLIRFFYPWADGIVAVSKGASDDLAQMAGLDRKRIRTIYNPVVLPELLGKTQTALEHPWFEANQPPVILGVGRLHPQKDFATLIQAFAQVRQRRQARLLILGEGPERPKLEALVKKLGVEQDASLPGFVTNPYPYMAHAALFVLSSVEEGLGNVLIEALYCGTSLISTDCPSGPREILKDGQYGQLVPVGDVTALARAIETALVNKTPPPPQESWRPFELETVVTQYINVLEGN